MFKKIKTLLNTSQDRERPFDWKTVSDAKEIDHILEASKKKLQVIYKHSSRCGTSFFALKDLQSLSTEEVKDVDFYMVDVITQRPVSNYIAEKLMVRHESPQLIILKNSEILWYGSHQQVRAQVVLGHSQ